MTRCPFALTTTCLLGAIAVVLYSAGQDESINAKVHWFLNHHVDNKHVRSVIEFAIVQGGVYYSMLVGLAHVIGYLVAVYLFRVSHAVAGKSLLAIVGALSCLAVGIAMTRRFELSLGPSNKILSAATTESGSVKRLSR